MRKVGGTLLAAVLLTMPQLLDAQRRPAAQYTGARHEFGVDVGVAYFDPDVGESGLVIGSPVDVRVGFLPRSGKLMWEPRLSFVIDGSGAGSGESIHVISPSVNVLSPLGVGTHRRGMYWTGGVGLNMVDFGAESGTGFSFNAALGWRKPYGSAALRYEVGIQWDGEIEDAGTVIVPRSLSVGGRIGLSFWN